VEIREMLDTLESFIAGLGDKNKIDINNAVFVANNLLGLNLPLEFRGAGRHGVKSLELYGILEDMNPAQKNEKAFCIGKMLANYSHRELMLMASYVWNEGRSSLSEPEREEAIALLKEKFGVIEKEHVRRPSAAAVSG
jgi:hypothetical protein